MKYSFYIGQWIISIALTVLLFMLFEASKDTIITSLVSSSVFYFYGVKDAISHEKNKHK